MINVNNGKVEVEGSAKVIMQDYINITKAVVGAINTVTDERKITVDILLMHTEEILRGEKMTKVGIKFDGEVFIERGTRNQAEYADCRVYIVRYTSGYKVQVQSQMGDKEEMTDSTKKCTFSLFSDIEKFIEKFKIERVDYAQYLNNS